MNCKPGDLAIVVRSSAGNEGKIVRCLKLIGNRVWVNSSGKERNAATWKIDQVLMGGGGYFDDEIADDQLRPIRDPGDDARDEMLRPLPNEVAA